MIAAVPEVFRKENDILFVVIAAKYAPAECTLEFCRAHGPELSDECLERLAEVFDEKAKMPDAEIYPYAKPDSWEEYNNQRVMEEYENWLFMANIIRDTLKKRREEEQNAESDSD